MTLTLETVVSRSPQIASRTVAGKAVLLKAPISTLSTLNAVGEFIWGAILEPKNIQELAVLVSEKFDVSVEQAGVDIFLFVKEMQHKELVCISEN